MTLNEEKVGKVLVLVLNGKLDIPGARAFLDRITQILDAGENSILIDFTGVAYINSTGLRALILVEKRMTKSGGWLHLAGLSDQIRTLFKISGLNSLFAIYPSKAEALVAFPE